MWQSWLILAGGAWITLSSFIWQIQTKENLIITGAIITILGFLDSKNLEGVMMGMLGIWVLLSGIANYLNLPINYFLTGLTIIFVAFIGVIKNIKPPIAHGH